MKYNSQYHFYSRVIISLMLFALGVFMMQRSVSTTAQISPASSIELTGWAWNEKVGWISLNCKNDFDGDGLPEDTCDDPGRGSYGLEVVSSTINGLLYTHIRGCAWAGTANDENTPSAGWLCFSDLPGLNTNAPENGILINQYDFSLESYSCRMVPGTCSNNPAQTCRNFGDCTSGNWCIQPLLQGVCYDYTENPVTGDNAGTRDELHALEGEVPDTGWPSPWTGCYIDDNCTGAGAPAGCVDGDATDNCECVYPQVQGRGACAVNNAGVISYSGATCTFDDDCLDIGPGIEYCEIEVGLDFITEGQDCTDTRTCATNYACNLAGIDDFIAYPNALDYASSSVRASWLTIATSTPLAEEDFVSFPINYQLQNDALPVSDYYDPDNPDAFISQSDSNPINGCFNCYNEEIKRCSPNFNLICTEDSDCIGNCTAGRTCSNNNSQTCTPDAAPDPDPEHDVECQESCVIRQINKKCDNCLEYFYYKDGIVNRCDDGYQIKACAVPGENTSECNGADCKVYNANKRCSGYDYFYCDTNADCIKEDFCQERHCILQPSIACNSDPECGTAPGLCFIPEGEITGRCYHDPGISCTVNSDCDRVDSCDIKHCAYQSSIACSDDYDCPNLSDYSPCVEREVGSLEKVLGGFNCSDCIFENVDNSCTLNAYNKNINRCGTCEYFFKTPGLILDNRHDRLNPERIVNGLPEMANLCGWALNGSQSFSNHGLGWINFSPQITTSSNPYFSVEQGNIYGQKNILSRYHPPFRKYNASYLIESGGTLNNLVSSSTLSEVFQGELSYRPFIDFLQVDISGKYKNVLGSLDYKGLITPASKRGGNQINKFGGQIVTIMDANLADFFTSLTSPLNNKVFHVQTSALTIDNSIEIQVSESINVSGAGVVVVEGDLNINANISYELSGSAPLPVISNLKNIPSIVWIIKGDIIIDPSVTELAGTFVVLGDGNDCSIIAPATEPADHCGQFITGTVANGSDDQLTVTGTVLARLFSLDRRYVDQVNKEPAEKFINDGRLQANPPLGLVDFSKAVPRFIY